MRGVRVVRVQGLRCRVQGAGFRVQGAGFSSPGRNNRQSVRRRTSASRRCVPVQCTCCVHTNGEPIQPPSTARASPCNECGAFAGVCARTYLHGCLKANLCLRACSAVYVCHTCVHAFVRVFACAFVRACVRAYVCCLELLVECKGRTKLSEERHRPVAPIVENPFFQ